MGMTVSAILPEHKIKCILMMVIMKIKIKPMILNEGSKRYDSHPWFLSFSRHTVGRLWRRNVEQAEDVMQLCKP